MRRLLAARDSENLKSYRGMYSDSPDLRSIGSDAHEWLKGRDEVFGIMTAHVEEIPYERTELVRLEAFENGNTGWAAYEQRWEFTSGESTNTRTTMVFQLEGGVWRIVQSHFSIPVSNLEVIGVDLTATLEDLLRSIDTDSEAATLDATISGTVTFVFTDIVDSTSLSQSMGTAAWSNLISSHLHMLQQIVDDHGGTTVKTLGDGGMFVFPTASSALNAASAIQVAVISSATEPELHIRIGIHTGDVVRDHNDYLGLTVNKAARVAAAAKGSEILVSASTAGMVNTSEFEFGDPTTLRLKGLDGTHVVQQLHWAKDNPQLTNQQPIN